MPEPIWTAIRRTRLRIPVRWRGECVARPPAL